MKRSISKNEFRYALKKVLMHVAAERLHVPLLAVGLPLSTEDLRKLSVALPDWIQEWIEGEVAWGTYAVVLRTHMEVAEELLDRTIGTDGTKQLVGWVRKCWPFFMVYPGDDVWDGTLYHLVHFSKTYIKVPHALYRSRKLRLSIEELYMNYEQEKDGFARRLRSHLKSRGPLSSFEQYLVKQCHMGDEVTKGTRIVEIYSHIAFCRLWRELKTVVTPADFQILKTWAADEAAYSMMFVEHLDMVDCRCI